MQQIVMPQPSLDIIKTATDSLLLPVRRPILFVPFIFTMALLYVLIAVVFLGTLFYSWEAGFTAQHIFALVGAVALSIFTGILAVEATVVLTVQAELGKELDLGEAVVHALNRFPVTLATAAVMTAGIVVGMILLVVPGLIVGTRWFLAPNVVLLSRRGVREALGMSWQMTGAHFGPLFGVVLIVALGTGILSIPLGFIPVVGPVAAAWLGFAWGGIALAMAHVRLGAPVDLG